MPRATATVHLASASLALSSFKNHTLEYPEFRENGVFASLGNIIENQAIGFFVDVLKTSVGLHVNGRVERRPLDNGPTPNSEVGQRYGVPANALIEQWVYVHVDEACITAPSMYRNWLSGTKTCTAKQTTSSLNRIVSLLID